MTENVILLNAFVLASKKGLLPGLAKKNISLIIFAFCLFSTAGISSALECLNVTTLFDIKDGFNQPSDLSVGPNGSIYLVDGVNNRIFVVGDDGRYKFTFGAEGTDKGQFKYPLGIGISDAGKVFIADTGNHRIQVFDLKGSFLYMFAVRTASNEKPSDPVDVLASNLRDLLYISDNDNHKIKVYKQNGSYEFEWGTPGEDFGAFRYPGMMTINKYNEVFVVDVLNTRVQKFDPFGKFISDIGSWGVLQGKFFRPKGIALDKNNRVFVSDSYMGVIQAFTDMGRFIGVVCENNKKRQFNTPAGIFIDKNNRLLVVEMRGNKITVLKILE
jgi:tripartite motif-containing protein 71